MTECGRESNGRDERDWKKLCAAASEEPDSEKLVSLVHQIIQAFNENDKKNPVAGAFSTDVTRGLCCSEPRDERP